eukprot:4980879-Pleurochrysis_carterae.AAC.1
MRRRMRRGGGGPRATSPSTPTRTRAGEATRRCIYKYGGRNSKRPRGKEGRVHSRGPAAGSLLPCTGPREL